MPPSTLHRPLQPTELFGVRVDVGDTGSAVEAICERGACRQGGLVCVANVDMLTRAKRTPQLAALMRGAVAVVTDGMPLVWALKRLRQHAEASRVYGPGLVLAVCEAAAKRGLSVFLYGGTPDELTLMQARLLQRIPALKIAGAVSPPMLPAEPAFDQEITDTINRSGAAVVFVGLGCPKQEFWMDAHQRQLKPVSIGVGLAFALIAGTKSQAPRWMRDHGLEWLYRLCQEPGRLWRRYLVGNTLFIGYVLRDLMRPAGR
jgi:N-acetylglucosaminyldiphosphoundecaprenol N-acetyl-beta-D-mannosaminyltransferase